MLNVTVRSFAMMAIPVLVCACSVTDYKTPVSDFGAATQDAEQALVALNKQVTETYTASIQRRILRGELFVRYEGGNCLTESGRCRLVAMDPATQQELPVGAAPALTQTLILMTAIREYGDGLTAIVNADTATQVATHVNATIGSVDNLGKTVSKLGDGGPVFDLSEFKTPAGQGVNWLAGQYIVSLQLDGLRQATTEAKPVIAAAMDLFNQIATEAERAPRATMTEAVSQRLDAYRSNSSAQTFNALVTSAATYDRFLAAKPSTVFIHMREAHDALADRLNDDSLSMADAMAKIKAFATEAKALAKIVQDLAAAAEKSKEG